MTVLITKAQRELLLSNGQKSADHPEGRDHKPVVKLFTPDAQCTWLLSELYPSDPDVAFGLCDLGAGFPELGDVRISEITSLRGSAGLPVERDCFFEADKSLSKYASVAREHRHIVT